MTTQKSNNKSYFLRMTGWIVILVVCLCFFAFSMAGKLAERERINRLEEVQATNSSTARIVEENVRQTLMQADIILLLMKFDMEKYGYIESEHKELLTSYLAMPIMDQIAATDAAGNLIFSAVPLATPLNISHREHFLAQVKQDRQLYIAAPWISRATGQPSIFLSRRVNDKEGNFAGIVAVGLRQQYLHRVLDRLELGHGSTIVLLRRDGALLGRVPYIPLSEDMINHFRTHDAVVRAAAGEAAGFFETSAATDGDRRFGAFRALPDYSLLVLAATPQGIVLRAAQQEVDHYWQMAWAFVLFIVSAFLIIWLQLRKQTKISEELHNSENRLRVITESAKEAIIMLDNQGTVSYWNPAAEAILGYTAAEMAGRNLHEQIVPQRYHAAHEEGFADFRQTGQGAAVGASLELAACHKNGYEITVEVSLAAIHSSDAGWQAVGILRDISERKRLEAEILHLATHDALTGLPSRRLANDRLATAFSMARRHKTKVALLFIDLDGFKAVNDTYGHAGGDIVLEQVAQAMQAAVRETDTVARVGGDEFWVIASDLQRADGAVQLARKIIAAISQPIPLSNGQALVGASVGIAIFPDDSADAEELIQLADQAMYTVKNSGKNGYGFANKDISGST